MLFFDAMTRPSVWRRCERMLLEMANFISWAKLIFYYLRADVRFGTRGARPAAQRWRGDSGKATFVADFGAKATRKK